MSRKEMFTNFIYNQQTMIDVEKIFQKCYSGYGEITDMDAKLFIFYATASFMCELLDDDNINITSSEIVSKEQVTVGLNFDNANAALTKLNKKYLLEYNNELIQCVQDKNIVGFLYVLSVIGHEVFHIYQYQCIENVIFKFDCLLDALELIKREMSEKFYEDNYNSLHTEVTASLGGIYLSINFVEKMLGRKLTSSEIEDMKLIFIENSSMKFNKYIDENELIIYLNSLIYDISDYIKENNKLVSKYPILNTIYNSNGNIKYIDEIIKDHELLSNNTNINKEDVNKLYSMVLKAISLDNKTYFKKNDCN